MLEVPAALACRTSPSFWYLIVGLALNVSAPANRRSNVTFFGVLRGCFILLYF